MKEVYYFTAPWCASCRDLKPHIAKVKEMGAAVREINVDEDPRAAQEHGVMQLPTVLMLLDQRVVSRRAGFSASLVEELYEFAR